LHTTMGRRVRERLLHGNPHLALARGRALRCVWQQPGGHVGAEVIDVAWEHQARMQRGSERDCCLQHGQCLLWPVRVRRVGCKHHDVRCPDGSANDLGVIHRGLDLPHQRTDRLTTGPWLAGDCVRGPAGGGEGFHQLATEASIAAQNDGGVAHFVLPWSPAAAGDWRLLR